jgi:hypothetical protein
MSYKIIDHEGDGFDDEVFATKEDVKDFLLTTFHFDFDPDLAGMSREEYEAQPLERILDDAHMSLEEV